MSAERKLAAIMFTDIVGYTALMAESEQRGLQVRERHRAVVRPLVERYGLGDRQAALDELERAYELRAYRILELGIDTRWDPVRSAPRFQDLTRRVGLTES